MTITLKTTLYMVLPMFCGCLETKNQLLPTEFRAISPNESVIYVSESTNRLVSLTPSTSEIAIKSISTNCFISNVVALSSETLIGQSKDAVFLGTTVDQSIHFLESTRMHVAGPSHLAKVDSNRFCVLSNEDELRSTLRCFRVRETVVEKKPSKSLVLEGFENRRPKLDAFEELSNAPVIGKNFLVRLIATSKKGAVVVSTISRPLELFSVSEDGSLRTIDVSAPFDGDGLNSMQWVDWSENGRWIVRSKTTFSRESNQPIQFAIALSRVDFDGDTISTIQEVVSVHALDETLHFKDPFIRVPVRFLTSDSFIVVSPRGWSVVHFSSQDEDLKMDDVKWKSYPARMAIESFEGIWKNSSGKELFAIRSGMKGKAALLELTGQQ